MLFDSCFATSGIPFIVSPLCIVCAKYNARAKDCQEVLRILFWGKSPTVLDFRHSKGSAKTPT